MCWLITCCATVRNVVNAVCLVTFNPETITIRQFEISDQQAVFELWNNCGLVVPWNDPAKDIERKRLVQPEMFLIALNDKGVIIGSIMAGHDGHRGAVNYLAVHPSHRQIGIAKKLMAEVEKLLTAAGCPKINLMVRHTNIEATAFYEALGYEPQDVVVYGKRLIED